MNGDKKMLRGYEVIDYINRHITWKQPGWTVTAEPHPFAPEMGGVLMLEAKVRNTYDPDNPALGIVTHQFPLPPSMPASSVPGLVRDLIHRAVKHEADEWFRVDGVMVFDPHAADR